MYTFTVFALALVLPLLSIWIEHQFRGATISAELVARWFVFWAIGVRLFMAGVRQIAQPAYTAQVILGLKSPDALLVVRELGFANAALGAVALISIFARPWAPPIALVGAIFFGLAGVNHLLHGDRTRLQSIAMISDLFIAVVLAACVIGIWKGR